MIFVATGSSTYFPGFPRLRAWMDAWAKDHPEPVTMQFGADPSPPVHATGFDFATLEQMDELTKEARVVVTHVGAGTLLRCKALGTPVIVVPRDPEHGEALDDHQEQLANRLDGQAWIRVARDEASLHHALDDAVHGRLAKPPKPDTAQLAAAIGAELDRVDP